MNPEIKTMIKDARKKMAHRQLKESLRSISKAKLGIYGIRCALKDFEGNDFENNEQNDLAINRFHASCLLDGIESLSQFIGESIKDCFDHIETIES